MLLLLLNIPVFYLYFKNRDEFNKEVLFSIIVVYIVFIILVLIEKQQSYLRINQDWQFLKGLFVPFLLIVLSKDVLKSKHFKLNEPIKNIVIIVSIALFYGFGLEYFTQDFIETESNLLHLDKNIIFLNYFLVCILAPFSEEIYFRGFLYHKIDSWSVYLFVSVISFTSVHIFFHPYANLIWILILGLILGLIRMSQFNLIGCIVFHFIYNIIALTNA